ncbi:MAG: hypothetical protein JXR96_08025 [Deltaproteobacteria bacterium]|nr:hypothetical protein [Deltaproteobacteria bacterium]
MRAARLLPSILALLASGCPQHAPRPLDCRPDLTRALEAHAPRDARERLRRAWGRLAAGRLADALDDFQRAAAELPREDRRARMLAALGSASVQLATTRFAEAGAAFMQAIECAPDSPEASMAAVQLSEVLHQVPGGHRRYDERVRKVLQAGALPIRTARALRVLLVEGATRRGKPEIARQALAELGVPPVWRLAGPYGRCGLLDFERAFAPESRPIEPESGVETALGWPEDGNLIVEDPDGREGLVYAETFLHLEAGAEIVFRLASTYPWALQLDDQLLMRHASHVQRLPAVSRRAVSLQPGWHRLLLKLPLRSGGCELRIELLGAGGRAAPIAFWDAKREAPPYRTDALQGREIEDPRQQLETRARQADPITPWLAGVLAWDDGDYAAGRRWLAESIQRAPGFALPEYVMAVMLLEDPSLPSGIDAVQSRMRLESALRKSPGFALARFRLAVLDDAQGRKEQSLASLAELERDNPTCFLWPYYRSRIQTELGQPLDAVRSLLEAEQRLPDQPELISALFDRARQRNALRQADRWALRLEEIGQPDSRLWEHWFERGRIERARRLLRAEIDQHPSSLSARLALARLLLRTGQAGPAGEVLDQVRTTSFSGSEAALLRTEQLDRTCRSDEARALRGQLSEAHPWDLRLRQAVAADGDEPFVHIAGDRRLDALKLIEDFRQSGFRASGQAVLVLDQASTEVAPDGSSLQRIHLIAQVLNSEGLERWGEIEDLPEGAVIESIRTIQADGSAQEAELHPGSESISLPGLRVGDFAEMSYLLGRRSQNPLERSHIGARFFFRTAETPIFRSAYSLAVHRGTALQVEQLAGAPEARVEREGRFEIHRFERTRSTAWLAERHAPPVEEFLPSVRLGFGMRWEDFRALLAMRLREASLPSPELRSFADASYRGATERERLRSLFRSVCRQIHQRGPGDDFLIPASHILALGEGNRTVLLAALLELLGYRPRVLLARTQDEAQIEHRLPVAGVYAHGLISVELRSGQADPIWMDPNERGNAFDVLYPFVRGMRALDLGTEGPSPWTTVPDPADEPRGKRIALDLQLEPDGTLHGRGVETLTDAQAVKYRELLGTMSPAQQQKALESGLGRYFGEAELMRFELGALSDPDAPLSLEYGFRAPRFARRTEHELIIRQGFYPYQLAQELISSEERSAPLLLGDDTHTHTRVRLALPDGARVDPPGPVELIAPASRFVQTFQFKDGVLELNKQLDVEAGRISREDYPAFRDFCREVDRADTAEIVIQLAPLDFRNR